MNSGKGKRIIVDISIDNAVSELSELADILTQAVRILKSDDIVGAAVLIDSAKKTPNFAEADKFQNITLKIGKIIPDVEGLAAKISRLNR